MLLIGAVRAAWNGRASQSGVLITRGLFNILPLLQSSFHRLPILFNNLSLTFQRVFHIGQDLILIFSLSCWRSS